MGIELPPQTPENKALSETGGAESGALVPTDPDLLHVIRLWPSLPESVRRAVLTLIDPTAERTR